MYYCICNEINEELLVNGIGTLYPVNGVAPTPEQVMNHLGKKFECGTCKDSIQEKIDLLYGDL